MRTRSASAAAATAINLVEALQHRLVSTLEGVSDAVGQGARWGSACARFAPVEWLRDGGHHGGGARFEVADIGLFNRASANVSHVHYDDDDTRPLRSATALSSIIHPSHPRAPSLHVHISWTELRSGKGSWRLMADLNPSIPDDDDTARFKAAVVDVVTRRTSGPDGDDVAATALAEGDRYFFIPALQRHRGVVHAYLEQWASGDTPEHAAKDVAFARAFGETVIDTYCGIVRDALTGVGPVDDAMRQQQLAYHTAYLFQVLTLDRGTTSGLLVHNENDVGILGSLPGRIDRALLASWIPQTPAALRGLVEGIVAALPDASPCPVDVAARQRLADVVRAFFRANPGALELQARGSVVPPTVANHGRP